MSVVLVELPQLWNNKEIQSSRKSLGTRRCIIGSQLFEVCFLPQKMKGMQIAEEFSSSFHSAPKTCVRSYFTESTAKTGAIILSAVTCGLSIAKRHGNMLKFLQITPPPTRCSLGER